MDVDPHDDLPYPELCHSWTHPSRLAAIATLSGMRPAPPERCRVLELGSASGGNLVPMAYGLPGSTFVGVDISASQIDAARSFAERVAVPNVRFEQLDLMDLPGDLGQFDYVIAHGVYSWVPAEVRDRLMAICREHLAPMGLAYVSYNTLPGWYPGLAVREMLLYRTRHLTDPAERAREAMRFAAELKGVVTLPGVAMPIAELDTVIELGSQEYGGVPAWSEALLLNDQVSLVNEPVYFHQFAEHADRHALQVVGEVGYRWMAPTAGLPTEAASMLAELTSDRLELEQYTDFALSRTFRRSLLCRADVELRAEPTPQDVVELHLLRLRQDAGTATDALAVDVLDILTEAAPRAVHFAELLDAVCTRAASSRSDELAACVLDLVIAGEVRAVAWAPSFASSPSARPLASPVARDQLRRSTLAASLRHTEVKLDGLPRALLLLLDGQRGRDELVDELVRMIDDGRMKVSNRQDLTAEQLRERLADIVEATLQEFAAGSLLVDEPEPPEQ